MKLGKGTWHYKFYRYLRNFFEDGPILPFRGSRMDYTPKSLCSYFWATVFMAFALPLASACLAVFGLVALILAPIWWPIMRRFERNDAKRLAALDAYYEGKGPHPDDLPEWQKRDSLIKSWFKAYKSKHCPLITLVD